MNDYLAGWESPAGILRLEMIQLKEEGRDPQWIDRLAAAFEGEKADEAGMAAGGNASRPRPCVPISVSSSRTISKRFARSVRRPCAFYLSRFPKPPCPTGCTARGWGGAAAAPWGSRSSFSSSLTRASPAASGSRATSWARAPGNFRCAIIFPASPPPGNGPANSSARHRSANRSRSWRPTTTSATPCWRKRSCFSTAPPSPPAT